MTPQAITRRSGAFRSSRAHFGPRPPSGCSIRMRLGGVFEGFACCGAADLAKAANRRIPQARLSIHERVG